MARSLITLFTILVLLPLGRIEAKSGSYAPVTSYIGSEAVLSTYYAHFVERYGQQFRSNADTFRNFCQVLRTSDLLADELISAGLPTDQIYAVLQRLEGADLRGSNQDDVRRLMLTVDYALESIESSLGRSHRSEFRREVLAQVPPLTHTG